MNLHLFLVNFGVFLLTSLLIEDLFSPMPIYFQQLY